MPAAKKAARKPASAKPTAKTSSSSSKPKRGMAATKARPPLKPGKDGVVRLSGGNPQIAKGDGDAPVQAYIAAMPGWKKAVGQKVDAVVTRAVPGVRKAVKWNSPMYGGELGWFLGMHVFTKYVKLAFFYGASLRPLPPGQSAQKDVRYLDIHEGDALDEAQITSWVRQAASIPGWQMKS